MTIPLTEYWNINKLTRISLGGWVGTDAKNRPRSPFENDKVSCFLLCSDTYYGEVNLDE